MSDYKLSIIMPTYNKAKYIKDAFNSIFMQETSFPYQVICADDCSTDGSVQIVEEYQRQHSNIVLLKSDKNHGLYQNVIRGYDVCKTDYFCVLDPDDYWLAKDFIQKAVDYLESHKDFTIYTTNTLIKNENDGTERKYFTQSGDFSFDDLLKCRSTWGHTSGTVFRNIIFKQGLPENLRNVADKSFERTFRGDSFRNFIHMEQGKLHAISEVETVYRITSEGIWTGTTPFEQSMLNAQLYINIYKYFEEKYPELLLRGYLTFDASKNKEGHSKAFAKPETFVNWLNIHYYLQGKQEVLESMNLRRANLKYRMYYNIFRKLRKKLKKKGILMG